MKHSLEASSCARATRGNTRRRHSGASDATDMSAEHVAAPASPLPATMLPEDIFELFPQCFVTADWAAIAARGEVAAARLLQTNLLDTLERFLASQPQPRNAARLPPVLRRLAAARDLILAASPHAFATEVATHMLTVASGPARAQEAETTALTSGHAAVRDGDYLPESDDEEEKPTRRRRKQAARVEENPDADADELPAITVSRFGPEDALDSVASIRARLAATREEHDALKMRLQEWTRQQQHYCGLPSREPLALPPALEHGLNDLQLQFEEQFNFVSRLHGTIIQRVHLFAEQSEIVEVHKVLRKLNELRNDLVRCSFLFEHQPPRVLKTHNRFDCSLRFLLGNVLTADAVSLEVLGEKMIANHDGIVPAGRTAGKLDFKAQKCTRLKIGQRLVTRVDARHVVLQSINRHNEKVLFDCSPFMRFSHAKRSLRASNRFSHMSGLCQVGSRREVCYADAQSCQGRQRDLAAGAGVLLPSHRHLARHTSSRCRSHKLLQLLSPPQSPGAPRRRDSGGDRYSGREAGRLVPGQHRCGVDSTTHSLSARDL
eukprot:m.45273 g.45273  ORF g.45273 m.45273 type:complete len:549 (+) comp10990_c0_seq3:833-2479(+)